MGPLALLLVVLTALPAAVADTYRLVPIEEGTESISVPMDAGWYLVVIYDGSVGGQRFVYVAPPGFTPPSPEPPSPIPPEPLPPGPDPDPTPPAPEPDVDVPNQFEVGRFTYDAARKIGKPLQARALADIYAVHAAKLVATNSGDGDAADVSAALFAIKNESDSLLGSDSEPWTAWRVQLSQRLATIWNAGKTKDRIAGALTEVEQALRMSAK